MNNNFNNERQKARHIPIFRSYLAKYLMNNGGICVDVAVNRKTGYEGKIVFFFEDDEFTQQLIDKYTLMYHDIDNYLNNEIKESLVGSNRTN